MHLTVMDYDVFSNDDFAGHVYFNLNDVCGLRGVVTGGFANVPQETRNIFHPKPGGQYFEGTHFDIHISSVILPLKLHVFLSFPSSCFCVSGLWQLPGGINCPCLTR